MNNTANNITNNIKRIKAFVLALMILFSACVFNLTPVYATDAKTILNSAKLYPCKTGITEVDERVADILTELRKTNKDTYSLMKAVYTYIVQNTDYGYTKDSVAANMTFHEDPLYETAIPDYVTSYAIDTIFDHQGECNNYNAAMIVFARAIGLEAYYYSGETHSASGGYVSHVWCEIKIYGTMYIFDPNVDYSIYTTNGSIMYLYFCKTEEELKDKYKWYPESDAKHLADFGEVMPESERITPPSYIYDQEETAATMPIGLLDSINDVQSAEAAVREAMYVATRTDNAATDDHFALYAEEAIARVAEIDADEDKTEKDKESTEETTSKTTSKTSSKTSSNKSSKTSSNKNSNKSSSKSTSSDKTNSTTDKDNTDNKTQNNSDNKADGVIYIDDSYVAEAATRANAAAVAVERVASNVNVNRTLRKKIRVVTNNNSTVTINKSNLKSYSDDVTVITPFACVDFDASDVAEITLENKGTNKVKVSFGDNTTSSTKVTVSFPNISTDGYRAVMNESGEVVGGKLNPITNEFGAKIDASGVYTVANNEKTFADIKDKSAEMQSAVKLLASKGIISGTSTATFSPDSSITRAEVSAIILRMTDKLDPNLNGGFSDVAGTDWYFGVAGSAKQYGIISGYPDNTFRGKVVIPKVQIVSVISRVLKQEMNYKDVYDAEYILTRNYSDSDTIAQWAVNDVALATDVSMVIKRNDYKFVGNAEMTRGDAAILLKRLYDKLW